ncbi:MAG: thioredoxin fold domain-containing protein [Leptolyngbyaceae cyanobacterium CSU_1_4]|nr:thioredoxin fold domain-containing protein [Leptolyngbyaceae cyanobacterium CSU_1_4]
MTVTPSPLASRLRNLVIVLVAVVLSVALFLGLRTGSSSGSLTSLAAIAVPLDVALKNGKPTLVEFYANWCSACQAMANDMSELEQHYGDRVNFVMLNVDNNKWLPEMLSYQVDGIPHFEFLTPTGEAIASTIGLQPRAILASNLEALATASPLPYLQNRGRVSEIEAPAFQDSSQARNDDPRSHGG